MAGDHFRLTIKNTLINSSKSLWIKLDWRNINCTRHLVPVFSLSSKFLLCPFSALLNETFQVLEGEVAQHKTFSPRTARWATWRGLLWDYTTYNVMEREGKEFQVWRRCSGRVNAIQSCCEAYATSLIVSNRKILFERVCSFHYRPSHYIRRRITVSLSDSIFSRHRGVIDMKNPWHIPRRTPV